jgi:1-acyl-sn-glycerol-3-phosphate acyltransferase
MLNKLAKNKSFQLLWWGQLISALGDRFTQMGILTFVLVKGGDSGEKTALITFFSLLPFLIFGPFFGALVDRYSRKKLMLFADFSRAVLVLGIPLAWINTHSPILIIALVFLLGVLSALFAPAKMSILTNITDKDVLLKANSMVVTTGMVATLVGTLIAGIVIKAVGVQVGFYINSLTYILSGLFILGIVYHKAAALRQAAENTYALLFKDIQAGLRYIRRHALIIRLMLLSSVFSLISGFAYILILNYGARVLNQGSLGLSELLSSAGFGMIFGSILVLRSQKKFNYTKVLYLSYFVIGVFAFSFVFRPGFYLCLPILFCAGMGIAVLTILLDTLFQRVTPDELKGKIFAARGVMANSVFLVSLLLVGFLLETINVTKLFALIGLVGMLVALRVFIYERRLGYQLLRAFLRLNLRLFFNFKVSGLENLPRNKRLIFAGNHTSLIDGVSLLAAYPGRVYFLAAESLFKEKFWGWCAKRLGYIAIKRGGLNKEAIKQAIGLLQRGFALGIFPEGKITEDGNLDEGKAGTALIAQLSGARIIPFAIEGAYEAWPISRKYPRPFPIEVSFGKAIDSKTYLERDALAEEIMQEISQVKLHLEREGYLRTEPDEIIRHLINFG